MDILPHNKVIQAFDHHGNPTQDLEVAADFSVDVPTAEMLRILQASDHVCVQVGHTHNGHTHFLSDTPPPCQVIPHRRGKMLFVPEQTADSTE